MKRIVGLWVLYLGTTLFAQSQVDTSFIYNTSMPYGTLDLRIAKSPTRYYYLQEGITFSYRESAPGVKTNTYTSMTTWNTSAYGQGNLREVNGTTDRFVMNYRLLKPGNYDPGYSPGYPIIIMFHGGGEAANCWIDTRCYWATAGYNPVTNSPPAPTDEFHKLLNNDRNLLHGGTQHLAAVNLAGARLPDDPTLPSRAFPGFVLFPQSLNGWGPHSTVEDAIRILRLLIKKYNIDRNRVYVHGLSNGGGGVYQALKRAPWLFAAALPMSAVNDGGIVSQGLVDEVAKLPLWVFQGGQDNNPTPNRTYNYIRNFREAGADVRYSFYPHLGHGTWNTAYNEPDFFSWILNKKKNNPHIYFGAPLICNSTGRGVKMGFSKGFFAYQWERDGQIIAGATGAEFTADTPGTYRGRFSRIPNPSENDWEPWSDVIVVSEMNPVKPLVQVIGSAHLRGPGLPSTDENNTVHLKAIDAAQRYVWYKDGTTISFPGTDIDDTLRTVKITSAYTGWNGAYTLVAYDNYCPTLPSDPVSLFFHDSSPQNIAISADDMGFKGIVAASSIFLSWNDASAVETGYEIWRRAGTSDFKFVTKTGEDAVSYHDTGLDPGTTYGYKLRAVNNSGRSNYVPSDDLNVNYTFTTTGDRHFPPPPQGLSVVSNTLTEITLSWKAARDESSIREYWVYYGNDSVSTESSETIYTITGLTQNSVYPVKVKAVDHGNHFSQPSNQVIATTYLSGLVYKHSTGAWESLDDSAMVATWKSPEFTGTVPNFTLQPRTQDDYFNFQFTGYLSIATEGTYYFNLTSSDGSRLLLDGNVIIDNDGIHGTRTVESGAIHLTAGPHPIEVQYFDDVGGHTLNVRYKGPGIGDGATFVAIPDAALRSGTYIPPASPSPPSGTSANGVGMQRIDIAWQYGDNAQTDYEVYRATSASGPFEIVIRASGTSAIDSIALAPGTRYYYKVRTVTDNGTSGFSNVTSATTLADNVRPSVPANPVLITNTMSNVTFSWTPSSDNIGVTGYEIYSGDELIGTSTIHAFTAEGLEPNTEYIFTVRAIDASGNRSDPSTSLVSVTTPSAVYYSLASGNLNELATWRTSDDGTGSSPQNFSDNGQYFIISNRTTTSMGGPWNVGGRSSRVIIQNGVALTADHPFSGNVELQGDATINLDHATAPILVKLSPQSTVNFNAVPVVDANTYGNVILSGTVAKSFEADTTVILGDLTISDGLALKGAPHNGSYILLAGGLTVDGRRPVTAGDNRIHLTFTGATAHVVMTNDNLYLCDITLPQNQSAVIVNPSGNRISIHLGSLNGGGLELAGGAMFNLSNHNLILEDAAVVNAGQQTGRIAIEGGNILASSTSVQNLNFHFAPENNTVDLFTVDLKGSGQAYVRTPMQVTGGIKVMSGTIVSGGNIVLRADSERTAAIYQIENGGRITGDVTVEQYLSQAVDADWYLSSPVNGVTVAQWQQSFPITGSFSGSSGIGEPSLFYYSGDEGSWAAYPPPGGANTVAIAKGVGYAAKIKETPITVSVKGNPHQGSTAFAITGGTVADGWNLIGNPYASPILWDNLSGGWTSSGVNNVVALRKNVMAGGESRSQVLYYDALLGGGVIPQGHAFWIKAFDASPALTVHESAKPDPDDAGTVSPDIPYITIDLRQGDLADPAYIIFSPEGSDGLDAQLDGQKLKNYGMFNFSTLTDDTVSLAVNHVSDAYCTKTIGLNVQDINPGSYSFSFHNLASLVDVGSIVLTDHFAGTRTEITGAGYNFSVTDEPASYGRGRFDLTLTKRVSDITTPQLSVKDACAPGSGYVVVSDSQPGALYLVADATGKLISEPVTGTGESVQIEILSEHLNPGPNAVNVSTGFPGCERRMFPDELTIRYLSELTVSTQGDVSVCEGDDVTLHASGGPNGGFYKWFDASGVLIDGETTSTLVVSNVFSEAVYYVASAHPDGCESERAGIHIYPDTLDMPVIQINGDTLFTDVAGYYQWKKDGEEIAGATLHYYVPAGDGSYSVVASNGGCVKESDPYQIGEPDPITGIEKGYDDAFMVDVFPVPARGKAISLQLRSPHAEPVLIEIVDALGRTHYRSVFEAHVLTRGIALVAASGLFDGVYFVRVTQAGMVARRKIIIQN